MSIDYYFVMTTPTKALGRNIGRVSKHAFLFIGFLVLRLCADVVIDVEM